MSDRHIGTCQCVQALLIILRSLKTIHPSSRSEHISTWSATGGQTQGRAMQCRHWKWAQGHLTRNSSIPGTWSVAYKWNKGKHGLGDLQTPHATVRGIAREKPRGLLSKVPRALALVAHVSEMNAPVTEPILGLKVTFSKSFCC